MQNCSAVQGLVGASSVFFIKIEVATVGLCLVTMSDVQPYENL